MSHTRIAFISAALLTARIASATPPARPDYKALVQTRHLADKEQALSKAFPMSETGTACVHTLTLLPFAAPETFPNESAALASELGMLHAHPADALASIAAGVQALPDRYARERQFIIQIAARLNTDPAKRIAFLVAELTRPYRPSADPHDQQAFFNGVIALDSLLELTKEPKVIQAALRQAFKANPSPQWRGLLLSRYEVADPKGAKELRAEAGL